MKITKKILSIILALVLVLGLLPATTMAAEEDVIYLSVSFDGEYISDKNGNTMVYMPVPLDAIASIDLDAYGLDNMWFDGDNDGNYDLTALRLLIYAHEELYGGDWSEVDFDATPGSSYFKDGIFGFTENLVYFHNGDFPIDDSQDGGWYTVGATSDRIVLEAGDFLDVASFSCYGFLWDMLGGFHFFADADENILHDFAVDAGQSLSFKLMHSFCDLMYGEAYIYGAADYEVFYGKTYGIADGEAVTDGDGNVELTIDEPGTYYLWCHGGNGSDDGTHGACDYYFENYEPCIVSAPGYAKITVVGDEEPQLFDLAGMTMSLGNSLAANFVIYKNHISGNDNYAVIEKTYANGTTKTVIIPQSQWQPYGNNAYYFTFNGVFAKEMTDEFTVNVYNANGEQIMNTYTRTIEDYCYQQILKEEQLDNPNPENLALYVDILKYGAIAQDYFDDYNMENPATARLSSTQLDYGTQSLSMTDTRQKGTGYIGSTLSLKNEISMNLVFDYATANKASYAMISFTNHYGTLKEKKVDSAEFQTLGNQGKYIVVDGMSIADCSAKITVTLYDTSGNTLSTCIDSVESYIARMSNADALYPAIMKLAVSAYNYFH